jgi:translation initiation factor IF-2
MAVTTVAQLAAQLNRPPTALLEQLQSAGVSKQSLDDSITESDKERLLEFLRQAHGTTAGAERKKISIVKKTSTEIKQADSSGRARTIQVEVRKKRTFVKRDDAPATDEPSGPSEEELELQRREEEARAQAEAIRQQEEELAAARRAREEHERLAREAAEAAAAEAAARAAAEALARAAAEAEAAAQAAASPARSGKASAKSGEATSPAADAPAADAPATNAPAPADAPAADSIACHLLWGDADAVAPFAVAEAVHEASAYKCALQRLPNVGHFVMLEAPDAWVAAVVALGVRAVPPPPVTRASS